MFCWWRAPDHNLCVSLVLLLFPRSAALLKAHCATQGRGQRKRTQGSCRCCGSLAYHWHHQNPQLKDQDPQRRYEWSFKASFLFGGSYEIGGLAQLDSSVREFVHLLICSSQSTIFGGKGKGPRVGLRAAVPFLWLGVRLASCLEESRFCVLHCPTIDTNDRMVASLSVSETQDFKGG